MAIVTLGLGDVYRLVTIGFNVGNQVTDVFLGGHFGFDEKRNKKEVEAERQRRETLTREFAKLSSPAQEKVKEVLAVNDRIDWTPIAVDTSRYFAALASIQRALREIEDEEDCLMCLV